MEGIEKLRERIIHHALLTYRRDGFAHSSMDALALELRMSKKTIYRVFNSKQALVEAVVKQAMAHVKGEIQAAVQGDNSVLVKFNNLLRVVSGTTQLYSHHWWKDIYTSMPHLYQQIDRIRHRLLLKNIGSLMAEGRQAGYFLNFPVEYVTAVFITTISAAADPANLLKFGLHLSELAPVAFEILINGILTEKGRSIFVRLRQGSCMTTA